MRPDASDFSPRAWRWLAAAALAIASALAYADAAPDALVFDDRYSVSQDRLTWHRFAELFGEEPWARLGMTVPVYRPLAMASIGFEGNLLGPSASRHHAANVALHVLVTVVLFGFLERVLRDRAWGQWPALVGALGAALVFGVHPVHAEAVDSIFNRSEMLVSLASIAALWIVWSFGTERPAAAWTGVGLLYLTALLCKESAATLPALIAVVLLALRPRSGGWRSLLPLSSLVLPLAAYALLRQTAMAHAGGSIARALPATRLTLGGRLELLATSLREALRLAVWPHPLRASYEDLAPRGLAVSIALQIAMLGLAVASARRTPEIAAGIGFFYVALLPSTRLFTDPRIGQVFAERFLYLPSVGLALALAAALAAIACRAGPAATLAGVGTLCGLLAALTWQRNAEWHSDVALWEADVARAPENGDAWMQLTTNYLRLGQNERIAELCAAHLAEHPDHAQFHNNCALANQHLGRFAAAEPLFRRAIALGSGAMGHANLARMLSRAARPADAALEYEAAVEAEIDPVMRHVRRAESLLQGRRDEKAAREELAAALALDPHFKPALDWLSRLGAAHASLRASSGSAPIR